MQRTLKVVSFTLHPNGQLPAWFDAAGILHARPIAPNMVRGWYADMGSICVSPMYTRFCQKIFIYGEWSTLMYDVNPMQDLSEDYLWSLADVK